MRFYGSLLGLVLLTAELAAAPPRTKAGCENERCTWRLWSHYEEKGCEPLYDTPGSCCPSRFNCPQPSPITGCRYGGRTFAEDTTVVHSDSCRTCTCQSGSSSPTGSPHVRCVHHECPELFRSRSGPNSDCRLLYSEKECCSTSTVCPPSMELNKTAECTAGNRSYVSGERMHFDDDQCVVCICGPGFSGPDGPGCRRIDFCYLESRTQLDDGCVPVYHEGTCCPIDWICPSGKNPEPQTGTEPQTTTPTANGCTFDGLHYTLGSLLNTSLACTTCTCTTPPDFTCEQRSSCA